MGGAQGRDARAGTDLLTVSTELRTPYLRSDLLEARHVSRQVLRLSAGGGEAVPVAEPSPDMRIMYKLDGKVWDYSSH